jgi:phage terminase large subunit-like protein
MSPLHREALALLGGLVRDDGRTWGEGAHGFQLADAEAIIDPPPGGPRWHFLLRPRGASKTSDLAGIALSLLVSEAPARSRSYGYAVDRDQANELLDAIGGFVGRTAGLAGEVRLEAGRVVVPRTGATLSIEAGDAASAYGKRPWLTIVDEFALWPSLTNHERLWAAVISAMPKVPGSRLVVITAGGSPHSLAYATWLRAQASPDWRTSHLRGPCPWWEPRAVEAVRAELTPAQYQQLIECQWVESDEVLASAADVLGCVAHQALEPQRGVRYVLALDVGTRRDLTGLAVAHSQMVEGTRKVVVDRVLSWRPRWGQRVDLAEVQAAVAGV